MCIDCKIRIITSVILKHLDSAVTSMVCVYVFCGGDYLNF